MPPLYLSILLFIDMMNLAHNPYPRKQKKKEIPNQRVGESKKKRKKIPNQRMGESKKGKERKFLIKETRRNVRKGLFDRTISEQYRIVTKWTKRRKGNHDLKWSSPFNCQPKSCALATFSPRTKQKQKRKKPTKKGKGQKHTKAEKPTKRTHSQGKPYWSMIMHVIFWFDRK